MTATQPPAPLAGIKSLTLPDPLRLECGIALWPVEIAYETVGTLNAARSNAVLICHALTGDQFAAVPNPVTRRPPWWPDMIGPGKLIDTNRYFVISTNVLGGCMGTTGPASPRPDPAPGAREGAPWGTDFPQITIADMVQAQLGLLDALGIDTLFAAIGGSMGGMQVLNLAALAPSRVFAAIPIATASRHSAQNIGFYEVGRQAIMADPDWREGHYLAAGVRPSRGLAVARMAAHITYMSEVSLMQKFDRELRQREAASFGFDADFQVESYLRHQGRSFVDRFDANSYLYITRALDYFDLAAAYDGQLARAFINTPTRFCVFAFSSDWHYPPEESRTIVRALNAAGAEVSYVEVVTDKGHDAFLLDEPDFHNALGGFLASAASARGLTR